MKLFVVLLCLALPLPAFAIVNLEDVHTRELPEGFSGSVGLDFSGDAGNTDKSSTSFGSQLHWQRGVKTDLLLLNYSYGESNGTANEDKAFIHARHIEEFSKPYSWELFGQVQNNRFARLSLRSLLGGGLRFKKQQDDYTLILGGGGFYEQERLTESSTVSDDRKQSDWRGNLYFIFATQLNAQTRFYNTTYYQPLLSDVGDYRILEQAGIKVKMAENLSLKLSIDVSYDSLPPAAVEDYDLHYSSGIEYTFD